MDLPISLWLVFLYWQYKMPALFMDLFHDCVESKGPWRFKDCQGPLA